MKNLILSFLFILGTSFVFGQKYGYIDSDYIYCFGGFSEEIKLIQNRNLNNEDAYYYLNIVVARNITYKDYAKQRRSYNWSKGRYKF